LLVVIAIIGLLASVILVSLNNARSKSRDAKRVADINQLAKGLELYFNSCQSYPVVTASTTLASTMSLYSGTLASCGNNQGGATNGGLGSNPSGTRFVLQMPAAPLPADSTICQTGSNNSYVYRSYDDAAYSTVSTVADTSAGAYVITFCLGEVTGGGSGLQAGIRTLQTGGVK
jgi:type II secretory pathway pseudopilin PulG